MKKSIGRIDIVVKYFYPVTAGIETNIIETYCRLVDKGWDVTIHTSKDVYMKKNSLKSYEVIRNLKVKRYRFFKLGYWPTIDWSKSDLICLHNFDMFPHFWILLYALIRKLLSKRVPKIVLTPHGGYTPEWSTFPLIQTLIKKTYHFTVGTFLINAAVNKVRAVSAWEAEQIQKKNVNPALITVISNGIEDEAYVNDETLVSKDMKKKVATFGKYIIQIGRIYPIKNYETTIKALSEAPSDLNYVIAGPNADKKYYKMLLNMIENLNLSKRVFFVGVIAGIDKYYLIRKAQMMVHMAIWESFCNVIHEGLSQGLICLVANNTALPYLIKNNINGYCIETKNPQALSKKINFVLKNMKTSKFREMKKRNQEFGLKESWKSVSEKMDSLYSKLIEKNRV